MRTFFALVILAGAGFLGACASDPPPPPAPPAPAPPPPPTRLLLQLSAQPDINPDGLGRPSPLLVRLYQLRSPAAFNSGDFFELYQNEKSALGADLVQKDEFFVRPGEQRDITLEPKTDAQVLGVFAAFRKLDSAQWRVATPITPHVDNRVSVQLSGDQISLTVSTPPAGNAPRFAPPIPGAVPPPQANPPQWPLPEVTPPQVVPPQVTPPQVTPPQITLPQVVPPQVTPPQITLPQVTPPQVTPPQVAPPALPDAVPGLPSFPYP